MIKIDKDYLNIPDSLQIPSVENFPDVIPRVATTTHNRRIELIEGGEYIDNTNFNSRYKKKDVKRALSSLYKGKCAFCEQKVEQYHVEHYRPKKIYYWLAFSWDNLLLSCPTCNQKKDINFDLLGVKKDFEDSIENRNSINVSCQIYDDIELPRMVNPESTNPLGYIEFHKSGNITSDNDRFSYTIEKCQIDRDGLNDERREILDVFKNDVESILFEYNDPNIQREVLKFVIRKFIRESKKNRNQYLAFRKYALSANWLNQIIKECGN